MSDDRPAPASTASQGWGVAAGVLAVVALAVGYVVTRPVAAPRAAAPESATSDALVPVPDPTGEVARASGDAVAPPVVEAGGRIELDLAAIAEQPRVALRLAVPTPPDSAAPLRWRLLGEGFEPEWAEAPLAPAEGDAAQSEARIEIDGPSLSRGRYVVELETRERSHFPLRRYELLVR